MRCSDWRLRETADLECGGLTPLSIFAFCIFCDSFGIDHQKCSMSKRHSQSGVEPPHSKRGPLKRELQYVPAALQIEENEL
jgi:hypothetical protein